MTDWSDLSDGERARRLLPILAECARADGHLDARELSFLRQLARQHGLSDAETEDALSRKPDAPLRAPIAEPDRMTVLYYLLFLTRADDEVSAEEEAVLHRYGLLLGIRPALVADFVGLAREYRDKNIPPAEMLGRIRAYLN